MRNASAAQRLGLALKYFREASESAGMPRITPQESKSRIRPKAIGARNVKKARRATLRGLWRRTSPLGITRLTAEGTPVATLALSTKNKTCKAGPRMARRTRERMQRAGMGPGKAKYASKRAIVCA